MFGRDDGVFVILAVGDFVGLGGPSWLSPSRALRSTIRTATSSCLAQVKQLCGNCRFSSIIDDLVTPPSMSSGTREPRLRLFLLSVFVRGADPADIRRQERRGSRGHPSARAARSVPLFVAQLIRLTDE